MSIAVVAVVEVLADVVAATDDGPVELAAACTAAAPPDRRRHRCRWCSTGRGRAWASASGSASGRPSRPGARGPGRRRGSGPSRPLTATMSRGVDLVSCRQVASVSRGLDRVDEAGDGRDAQEPGRREVLLGLSLFAHHRVIIETSNLLRDAGQRVARLDLVRADEVGAVRDGGVGGDRLDQRAVVMDGPSIGLVGRGRRRDGAGLVDRARRRRDGSTTGLFWTSPGSVIGVKLVSSAERRGGASRRRRRVVDGVAPRIALAAADGESGRARLHPVPLTARWGRSREEREERATADDRRDGDREGALGGGATARSDDAMGR